MRSNRVIRAALLASAVLALGGCILNVEDIEGVMGGCDDLVITSFQSELFVGDSLRLSARQARADGSACTSDENEGILWRSSSPYVASVHDGAWLVGVNAGWATATAENLRSGAKRSVNVRVSRR